MNASTPDLITPDYIASELQRLENMSTRLAGVISALGILQPEHQHTEAAACLVFLSEDLAKELNQGLDALSVNASGLAFELSRISRD